jgi:hypothetical protein
MIRNIRYIDCQAIHCGGYVSNEIIAWTTGFDLREDNDIEDCIVIRCQAIDNWESGFHFEPRYAARIRMEDCVSSGNGQRKLQAIGMLESDENPRGLFFGSGFFVHLDAELINCTAENNVVSGFWTWGGDYVFFTRCRDNGSGDGFRITHNSQDITYDDCTSQNSRGYALYAWNCHDLVFRNFSISSPEGENGRCISLGLREGAADIYPVQSSSFDMHVSGGKSPTVLYIHQGMDLSFSGSIDTAQPYPVVISGVTTKNIRFQDFSILSSGGQAGITVESGVRDAGSIWVINSLIEGKEKPLQAGIVNNAAAPVVTTGLTIRGANVACTKCSTSP